MGSRALFCPLQVLDLSDLTPFASAPSFDTQEGWEVLFTLSFRSLTLRAGNPSAFFANT